MYKLLIVDDDMLVRMDIRVLLDWESMGIQLVEDASNGLEALKQVERFQPDILIMDLGMPLMNGLETINRLKAIEFQGKIIVLSCHDDFDNVKEAMSLGAADYILKHLLKPESLKASIQKTVALLEKENRHRQETLRFQQMSRQSLTILKDALVKSLVEGHQTDRKEVDERLEQLGMKMEFTRFMTLLVEVESLHQLRDSYGNEQMGRLLTSMRSVIEETAAARKHCLSGSTGDGEYCLIVNCDDTRSYMSIHSEIYELSSSIQSLARNIVGISVSIGISKLFTSFSSIGDSYSQARLALDGKLFIGRSRIIHFSEIENFNGNPGNIWSEHEEELYEAVQKKPELLKKRINGIFTAVKSSNVKLEYARLFGFELLALASRMARDFKVEYETVFGCEYLPYRHVTELETFEDMEKWFTEICMSMSEAIQKKGDFGKRGIRTEIQKVLAYIAENYMHDITLQEAADQANLSRTYFCQLFKQELHENFGDYLNRYRINKAKTLLTDSCLKIYEVGMTCGFENYRYFTRIFKEITGCSPGEFRETQNHHKPDSLS